MSIKPIFESNSVPDNLEIILKSLSGVGSGLYVHEPSALSDQIEMLKAATAVNDSAQRASFVNTIERWKSESKRCRTSHEDIGDLVKQLGSVIAEIRKKCAPLTGLSAAPAPGPVAQPF